MREPVVPLEQSRQIHESESLSLDIVKQIVAQLPLLNYRTLKFCIQFFQEVSSYSQLNRMPAESIAIRVGPLFFSQIEHDAHKAAIQY